MKRGRSRSERRGRRTVNSVTRSYSEGREVPEAGTRILRKRSHINWSGTPGPAAANLEEEEDFGEMDLVKLYR